MYIIDENLILHENAIHYRHSLQTFLLPHEVPIIN